MPPSWKNESHERTAELTRSENRLAAIVSALPDLVFVVDEDGRYLEILTSKEELLFRPPAEMKGRRFHDILPGPVADTHLQLVRGTLKTGASQVLEYSLEVQAGERWFEGRTGLLGVEIENRRAVAFIVRDITDKKRAEELESQNIYLREELKVEQRFGAIVGRARAMQQVFKNIEMVAATDSTVLILGETGTGKELIARAIHDLSRRKGAVMIKVNCGALPSALAESELFGHERGAFTGAVQQKKGRFELANHGTIFLDEVGELSADVQVKLLRVLQEQELERLGSTHTTKVDVRVIAATNRDLHEDVRRGTFRADLFYRLNIFPIHVPPLRERKEDVPLLVDHFVAECARRMGKSVRGIGAQAAARLTAYEWPGNIRELANVLERAVILCQGDLILEEHIGALTHEGTRAGSFSTLEEMERQHILTCASKDRRRARGPARRCSPSWYEPVDRMVAYEKAGYSTAQERDADPSAPCRHLGMARESSVPLDPFTSSRQTADSRYRSRSRGPRLRRGTRIALAAGGGGTQSPASQLSKEHCDAT